MCYHNSMTKKARELAKRYGKRQHLTDENTERLFHASAFNCPQFPIITEAEEIQEYRWGLIPHWTKTITDAEKIRKKTFNARAESIFQKPSFRQAIKTQRCIVPSTGFFDWRHENGKKTPYFISLKKEDIFSIAGIYDEWKNPETGQTISTFSIITTKANPLMRYIHNTNFRMPVILPREEEEKWLYPILKKNDIEKMLQPIDETVMSAYPLKNNFLQKPPHDPSILTPAPSK